MLPDFLRPGQPKLTFLLHKAGCLAFQEKALFGTLWQFGQAASCRRMPLFGDSVGEIQDHPWHFLIRFDDINSTAVEFCGVSSFEYDPSSLQILRAGQRMKNEILSFLAPVRSRLRVKSMISLLAIGATVGGGIGLLLGIARATFAVSVEVPQLLSILFGCTAIAGVVGLVLKRPWTEAAAVVDAHYRLKDRTITALEFAAKPESSPFKELQLQDATGHLQAVDAKVVVPFKAPKQLAWACLTVAAAGLVLLLLPIRESSVQAEVLHPEGIDAAANEIQNEIELLEELAEESGIEELKDLVVELKKDLEELEKPETDVRESLETISEMQQKMQEMMATMNIAAMDAQLSAVAEAMSGAEAFKAAAEQLKKEDLEKAAEALEEVDAENMDRTESRPTSEKLSIAAASAKKKGMGKLSETLDQLAESVKTGDSKGTCENCNKLAQAVKKHSLCKSMCNMLKSKCDKLGECKKLCSGNCDKDGNGASAGQGLNMAQGQTDKKSNSPSQKAGAKSAGNIDGQKTKLDSQRQMATLTGQMGADGDSEFETTTSTEAEEQATRRAKDAFAKYQKMSEAVLDSEPIPLGHRQTIRNYFELIRPSGDEDKALSAE